jgi:hypothetical protein
VAGDRGGAVGPQTFTLRTIADRVAAVGDLWAQVEAARQSLRAPLAALETLLTENDWKESMAATTPPPDVAQAAREDEE